MQFTFKHRAGHAHVFEPFCAQRVRVIQQYGEVGFFTRNDGANLMVQIQAEGGIDSDAAQCLLQTQALLGRHGSP